MTNRTDTPKIPRLVTIEHLKTGTVKTYTVVGLTHSGSRGWEYELSPINADRPGMISRVCHAPMHRYPAAITSGERIAYQWSPE